MGFLQGGLKNEELHLVSSDINKYNGKDIAMCMKCKIHKFKGNIRLTGKMRIVPRRKIHKL